MRTRPGLRAAALLATVTMSAAVLGTAPASASTRASTTVAPTATTPAQRAARLVAQMTLDEKISMVHGDGYVAPGGTYAGHVPGVPRLGIPDLYLSDGPNGVGNGSTGVTQFPVAVTDAASWDTALVRSYGAALGAEQRGKGHNVALAPTLNILRTPLWGRESETYTEDPYLNRQTAAAEVRGIQSNHVIATPKHYVANNQETGRVGIPPGGPAVNELISQRALQEIYYPGFKASVQQGGAGAVMCAYNRINGQYACQNTDTMRTLEDRWAFTGFVMSDWFFAVRDTVLAAKAGTDLEMPLGTHYGNDLKAAVQAGTVPMSTLDEMVRRILTSMIRLGLFDHPVNGVGVANVSTAAHRVLARQIAEQGAVLLKNAGGALPLGSRTHSLAVIGDAAQNPQYTEGGSGAVLPSATVSPLAGIRARAGTSTSVTYAPGTRGIAPLPVLTGSALHSPSGAAGLLATYFASADWSGTPITSRVESKVDFSSAPVSGLPRVWSARWTGTFTPSRSGEYRFSLNGGGAFSLYINGRRIAYTKYADFPTTLQPAPVRLTAGQPVSIRVDYTTAPSIFGAALHVGEAGPDALRAQAVAAARAADAVVVFVDDVTGEGSDRTTLSLPGDQNELIAAVAKANRHTVVVLNTGGPVLAPWLSKVAGVLEMWYPGQEYGDAVARLLFGDANPSGKLPMTWPASERQGPASSYAALSPTLEPYSEGILVGYRWYDARGQRPLFPFGYGLSYTGFRYGRVSVSPCGNHQHAVAVRVTNTGRRAGAEVVQLYVGYPRAANEPPQQLKGYVKVVLRPGETRRVTLRLRDADLAVWRAGGGWSVVPGRYRVLVGTSSRDIRAVGSLVVRH